MFQINTCPLCDKACQLSKVAGIAFFTCPTNSTDFIQSSHYKVRIDSETEVQHILIYPYSIDSFANTSQSRVYYSSGLKNGRNQWKFLMEVPLIRAEAEHKLLKRLNSLVIFL